MTIKELLKPRYKVIAEYPGGIYKVGDFVQPHAYYGFNIFPYPEKYPHLFKPIEWWEERDEKNMPEYVKLINTRPSYGLPEGHISRVSFEKSGDGLKWIVDMFPVYVRVDDVTPATESEYNEFINQSK